MTEKQSLGSPPQIPLHPRCFIDDQTPISISATGEWKPIKKIKVGDLVLTHKMRFRKVTELIITPNQKPIVIEIGVRRRKNKSIIVTIDHPIFIDNKPVTAKDIKIHSLATMLPFKKYFMDFSNEETASIAEFVSEEITSIKIWLLDKSTTLYNFSVDEDESYIANGFVVHNCRCILLPETVSFKELGLDIDEIEEVYRPYTLRVDKSIDDGRSFKNTAFGVGTHKGNFESFYNKQHSTFQSNLLGPSRQRLIDSGAIDFKDLVDPNTGHLFSLKELGFSQSGEPI